MIQMEHFKWSVEVYFRVWRVTSFNGLYSAPRPFLLTLTTVNVDMTVNIDLFSHMECGIYYSSHTIMLQYKSMTH